MNDSSFAFHFDSSTRVFEVRLTGFWTSEVVKAYDVALDAALDRLARSGILRAKVLVLIDRRELQILPKDVVVACQEVIARIMHVGKVAIVVPNILSKLQVDRIIPLGRHFFKVDAA